MKNLLNRGVRLLGGWALLLVVCVATTHPGWAQATIQWQRTYGLSVDTIPGAREIPLGVAQLSATRFLFVGYNYRRASNSYINPTPYLVIVNAAGDSLTTRSFPALYPGLEGTGVANAAAGIPGTTDALVMGTGVDAQDRPTAFVMQVDSLGQPRWMRYFDQGFAIGEAGGGLSHARILPVPDGYLVLRTRNSTPYQFFIGQPIIPVLGLTKLDRAGNVLWQRSYGGRYATGSALVACPDGSYAISGYLQRAPTAQARLQSDLYLLRVRPNGDTIRSRRFGTATDSEYALDLSLAPDGGLLLAGTTTRPNTPDQGLLLRLDSLDQVQWTRQLSSPYTIAPYTNGCRFYRAQYTATNEVVVGGGCVAAVPRNGKGYLALYPDAAAGTRWELFYNNTSPTYGDGTVDWVYEPSGRALLLDAAYRTSNDAMLTRVTGLPAPYQPELCRALPQAEYTHYRPAPDSLVALDISIRPGPRYAELATRRWDFGDGTVVDGGPALVRHRYAQPPAAATRVTLTVTNSLGCAHTVVQYPFALTGARPLLAAQLSLYPNPAHDAATLTLDGLGDARGPVQVTVLDALGRPVQRYAPAVAAGTVRQVLDVRGLPVGVYAVQVRTPAGATAVRRLVRQ